MLRDRVSGGVFYGESNCVQPACHAEACAEICGPHHCDDGIHVLLHHGGRLYGESNCVQPACHAEACAEICGPHHCDDGIHVLLHHGGRPIRVQPHRHRRPLGGEPDRAGDLAGHRHFHHAGHRRQRRDHEEDGRAEAGGGSGGFHCADPGERGGGRWASRSRRRPGRISLR